MVKEEVVGCRRAECSFGTHLACTQRTGNAPCSCWRMFLRHHRILGSISASDCSSSIAGRQRNFCWGSIEIHTPSPTALEDPEEAEANLCVSAWYAPHRTCSETVRPSAPTIRHTGAAYARVGAAESAKDLGRPQHTQTSSTTRYPTSSYGRAHCYTAS